MKSLIFDKISFVQGYQFLKNNLDKNWLIRESEKDGMLAVDFNNNEISYYENPGVYNPFNSIRFALINDTDWVVVGFDKVEEMQNCIHPVTKEISNKDLFSLLLKKLENVGFKMDTVLLPTTQQASKNKNYIDFDLSKISEKFSNLQIAPNSYNLFAEPEAKDKNGSKSCLIKTSHF